MLMEEIKGEDNLDFKSANSSFYYTLGFNT